MARLPAARMDSETMSGRRLGRAGSCSDVKVSVFGDYLENMRFGFYFKLPLICYAAWLAYRIKERLAAGRAKKAAEAEPALSTEPSGLTESGQPLPTRAPDRGKKKKARRSRRRK